MTQSPHRLSKEREAEIRELVGCTESGCGCILSEVFSEIAALRLEASERNKSIEGQAYLMKTMLESLDFTKEENAKLRAALERIAAPPDMNLYDFPVECQYKVNIAREALKCF